MLIYKDCNWFLALFLILCTVNDIPVENNHHTDVESSFLQSMLIEVYKVSSGCSLFLISTGQFLLVLYSFVGLFPALFNQLAIKSCQLLRKNFRVGNFSVCFIVSCFPLPEKYRFLYGLILTFWSYQYAFRSNRPGTTLTYFERL